MLRYAIPLFGAPCSGKSTAAKAVMSRHLPLCQYFSSGDFLRQVATEDSSLGAHVRELNKQGLYLDDSAMLGLFGKELPKYDAPILLLDGIPRTREQSRNLGALVRAQRRNIPFGIHFNVSYDVAEERFLERRANEGRADDKNSYASRFATYNALTTPVVQAYDESGHLRTISADNSPGLVSSFLEEKLEILFNALKTVRN